MMLLECSFVKIYRHAYISHLHELFTSMRTLAHELVCRCMEGMKTEENKEQWANQQSLMSSVENYKLHFTISLERLKAKVEWSSFISKSINISL